MTLWQLPTNTTSPRFTRSVLLRVPKQIRRGARREAEAGWNTLGSLSRGSEVMYFSEG